MHDVVGEVDHDFATMLSPPPDSNLETSIKASCDDAAGEVHAWFQLNAKYGMAACLITAAMLMTCIDHAERRPFRLNE